MVKYTSESDFILFRGLSVGDRIDFKQITYLYEILHHYESNKYIEHEFGLVCP